MKIGDVSRSRRFANPARQRWYAYHRSVRFALRMLQTEVVAAEGAKTPSAENHPPDHPRPTTFDEVLDRLAEEVE
jgi:hypothetical protein